MPGLAILPTAQPHPFAGQNAAAFKKIFEVLGEGETMRRKKMLNTDILGILQGGGDPQKTPMENIAAAVQRHQEPTYSPEFLPSLFQKIASPFAEAPGAGITDALVAESFKPLPRTKIQEYMAEGYSFEEAMRIRDIHFGKEPRASSRLMYDKMSDTEKLKYLTSEKLKAEGQYFGLPAELGNIEPRDPIYREWILRELNKLPEYQGQTSGALPPEQEPSEQALTETPPTKALHKDFEFDMENALDAIKQGANSWLVFKRLYKKYGAMPKEYDIMYDKLLPLMPK